MLDLFIHISLAEGTHPPSCYHFIEYPRQENQSEIHMQIDSRETASTHLTKK